MTDISHEYIDVNGITLHVAASGPSDGSPVVLCHGFPELWYSWRHQLGALGEAGYRALAPDLRGYGSSSHPADSVASYRADHVAADFCGLLDHHGWDEAAFVGHDWGAISVWEMGRLHPDRMSSIYNMSVPYSLPPDEPPIARLEKIFGDRFFYILYFQPVGTAEAELESSPREFLRNFYFSASGEGMATGPSMLPAPMEGTGLLDTLRSPGETLPAWLSEADLEVCADAFEQSGFFGPLSYYRNLDANWELTRAIPASRLSMPVGFLTGSLDPVRGMFRHSEETMATSLSGYRGSTVIEGAGHWVQQERPAEVTDALLSFLDLLR